MAVRLSAPRSPKGVLNSAHGGLLPTSLESRFSKDGEFVIGGKSP